MNIAIGADSAGKPLLDVIAAHLATKPEVRVNDLSQSGYYADLSQKLAANGYTHLLVRRDTADGPSLAEHAARDGLSVAARFADGQVFAVEAPTRAILGEQP